MEHHSLSFPFHFTLLFSSLFLSQGCKIDEKSSLVPNVSFNEVTIFSWRLLVFKIMRRISSNEMSQEFLIFSCPLPTFPPPRSHKICLWLLYIRLLKLYAIKLIPYHHIHVRYFHNNIIYIGNIANYIWWIRIWSIE